MSNYVLMKVIVSKDHFYDKIFYIVFLKSPNEEGRAWYRFLFSKNQKELRFLAFAFFTLSQFFFHNCFIIATYYHFLLL